jgi:hypothetical protein
MLRTHSDIEAVWEKESKPALTMLGTVKEICKTATDLKKTSGHGAAGTFQINDAWLMRTIEKHCAKYQLDYNNPVGSPDDVHYTLEPKHTIGYLVKHSLTGYTLEVIEALDVRLTVLRRFGRLAGCSLTIVTREEKSGPVKVV